MEFKVFGECWRMTWRATDDNNGKDKKVMQFVIFNQKYRESYGGLQNQCFRPDYLNCIKIIHRFQFLDAKEVAIRQIE